MNWVSRTFKSSVGCKLLMALTGLMLVGFLIAHLSGNLLVFAGPEALNLYAKTLRDYIGVLWVLRLGLIAAFCLHIFAGVRLTALNRQAKPKKYKVTNIVKASLFSRYMMQSGFVVLSFVCYHLAHLTFKATHPEFLELGEFDVYTMLVSSFKDPFVSGFYILSVSLLMAHLNHGISSSMQTLGLCHSKYNALIKNASLGLCVALALGFVSIPVSIFAGYIR